MIQICFNLRQVQYKRFRRMVLILKMERSTYNISIFVKDGADQNTTYNLELNLRDIDENPPVFTSGSNIATHLALVRRMKFSSITQCN